MTIPPRRSKAPAHRWNFDELPGHTYFAMVYENGARRPECFCGWKSERMVKTHKAAASLFTKHLAEVVNGGPTENDRPRQDESGDDGEW